jgi:hypothetical protein
MSPLLRWVSVPFLLLFGLTVFVLGGAGLEALGLTDTNVFLNNRLLETMGVLGSLLQIVLTVNAAVVGVTRDGKYLDIDDGPTAFFWTSLYQDYSPHLAILVKGVTSAETMVPLLRREVPLAENELSLMPPSTLARTLDLQRLHLRVASRVLGWGGLLGLVLAVMGIYGIVSFTVTQRGHELAIRMAVGAQRGQVLRMVLRDGLVLAAVGLGVGMTVLVPLAWLARSQLFGIGPADPLALGASSAAILSAALVASLVPASRATRIDPMRALRDE